MSISDGENPPERTVVAPPSTVNAAFWLYIGSAVISVIGGIVTIVVVSGSRPQALAELQRSGADLRGLDTTQVLDATIAAAVVWSVATLLFWVIGFVLFAFFVRRGARWARIVLTVLTVLSVLNTLTSFGIGALQVVLSIAAAVLLWMRPSTEYLRRGAEAAKDSPPRHF